MKIEIDRPDISSAGLMQEHMFGISDMGMIFEILRNKMYSNKPMAICKEISCNARDAHREVGKGNIPIEITLPNNWDPKLRIKDYGPGISPDRMTNIFIKYAASTKRNDNMQTGGFGLGAKTPFSYADSFSIITIVDDVEYHYAAFIDETKVGKLSLLDKISANGKPNSTEIIIPIKPNDFNEFSRCIEEVTRHWDECPNSIRPIINGGTILYSESKDPLIEGNDWKIFKSRNRSGFVIDLVIDGILYNLDTSSFRIKPFWKNIGSINGILTIYFEIGKISLAANRESVHLDEKTEKYISDILSNIYKEFKEKIELKIQKSDNYWEACDSYVDICTMFYGYGYPSDDIFKWNGLKLSNHGIRMDHRVTSYKKQKGSDSISKNIYHELKGRKSSKIFVNDFLDCKEISLAAAKKIFEKYADSDIDNLLVIMPGELNSTFKEYSKHIAYENLSSILSPPKSFLHKRITFSKFEADRGSFLRTSIEFLKDEKSEKAYVFLEKTSYNNEKFPMLDGKKTGIDTIARIQNFFPKLLIYGLDLDAKGGNFDPGSIIKDSQPLSKYITDNIPKHINIDINLVRMAISMEPFLHRVEVRSIAEIAKFLPKDNVINKYIDAAEKIRSIMKKYNELSNIISTLPEPEKSKYSNLGDDPIVVDQELNVEVLIKEINENYSLLKHLNYYYSDDGLKAAADYIMMVDKLKEISEKKEDIS